MQQPETTNEVKIADVTLPRNFYVGDGNGEVILPTTPCPTCFWVAVTVTFLPGPDSIIICDGCGECR